MTSDVVLALGASGWGILGLLCLIQICGWLKKKLDAYIKRVAEGHIKPYVDSADDFNRRISGTVAERLTNLERQLKARRR